MKRKLLIALLATVLCLSVALLAACGCKHYYENGVCTNCGEPDPNYDPNNLPCSHYYENGLCKFCSEADPNYQPPVCDHYYQNGACNKCGEVDPNYVAPNPGDGEVVTATAISKAVTYGKDAETYTLTGVVYATITGGYFINDGTASIFVNDSTAVAVGDQIVATGAIAFATNWKMPSLTATETAVKQSGQAALTATEVEIASLYGTDPVLPTSFYNYVKLSGMVSLQGQTYQVSFNGASVNVASAAASQFEAFVDKNVEFEAVLTAFSTEGWEVTPVGEVTQKVPNLAEVADGIFDWVATQLPEGVYSSLELPTSYELQPGVEFNWTVQTGTALTIENNQVTINSVSADETVVLLLTLTAGNHAPQTKTFEVVVKYSLMSIGEILSSEHGTQIKIQGVIGGFAAQTVTTYEKPQNGLVLTDGTGVLVIDDLGDSYRDGDWVDKDNNVVPEGDAAVATRNGEYVVDGHKLQLGDKVEIVGEYTNIPATETNFGQRKVVVTSIKYLNSGNEIKWKGPDVVVSNEAEAVTFAKNWYVGMVVKLVATTENPLCIRCSGSKTAGKTTWSLHYRTDDSTTTLANLRYVCADGVARAIGVKGESSEYALGAEWWKTLGMDYKNDKTLNKKQFTGEITLVITAYGNTNIQTTAISMALTPKA